MVTSEESLLVALLATLLVALPVVEPVTIEARIILP
jgi:hypothetical protein